MGKGAASFRLVRYFTAASLVAFAAVAAAMVYFEIYEMRFFRDMQQSQARFFSDIETVYARQQNEAARRDLVALQEEANVNLTQLFANMLWEPASAGFAAKASAIPVESCRQAAAPARKACFGEIGARIMALPEFKPLDAKIFAAMRKSSVFKIKVYDRRGITVYSSEHAQIGEDKSANAGWISAMKGVPASDLVHRNQFNSFDGEVENRDLIQSYLPVRAGRDDLPAGVFEVYADVTPFLAQIEATSARLKNAAMENQAKLEAVVEQARVAVEGRTEIGSVLGLLALLWLIMFLIARNGQRLIDRHQAERAIVEQRLAQSEKMAALGGMVAGFAHQMNTPLAFSHNNVSLVLEQLKTLEASFSAELRSSATLPMREMLHDVLHGLEQMSELVVHMREFAQLDRAGMSDVDLNRSLKSVVYIARNIIPARIQVIEDYRDLPAVHCSASHLNQVFLNLLTNAAEAIEGRGTILVRTSLDAERVCVEVADDGRGIPEDVLPHVFERYFTTKPAGTGLGLAIARDVVSAHGGEIRIASRPGAGTRFTVLLPRTGAAALAKAA
ncbi:MAG TPA: ATP-binding protein [Burkholderiales bacterium]